MGIAVDALHRVVRLSLMTAARKAIRMSVSEPEADSGFCVGSLGFDNGTVIQTPISDFSDLRRKASDHGLADGEVVVSPETVAWLKDREGWPDSTTVGKI
jgi:hypothetical protein